MHKTAHRKRILATGVQRAAVLSALILTGCPPDEQAPAPATSQPSTSDDSDPMVSVGTLFDAPDDFARSRIDSADYPIPKYAKFLRGVRICLDPGHGGDADQRGYKRGPTGVREAEINLRVAGYLRDFLDFVGAEVVMTREADEFVSLERRAQTANECPAQLFISCHHNASETNPEANHTSIWYHGEVDDRPSNLDLARHLCQSLLDELPQDQISDVPLRSDQLIYPEGFQVLRLAKVTAVLVETSFFTHPAEEQRLRDPEYNLREAYALFLGLARYAFQGLPDATLSVNEERTVDRGVGTLEFILDDGLRSRQAWGFERRMILDDTIAVYVGGTRCDHAFRADDYRLLVTLPRDLAPGEHRIRLHFQNMYKNANLEPDFAIRIR